MIECKRVLSASLLDSSLNPIAFTSSICSLQTEVLEGQEHDHSITSKINLVDLAGSERQSLAQTSGERLRVGTV